MRDLVVRLASMKLAEVGFQLYIDYYNTTEGGESEAYKVPLKEIPKIINTVLKKNEIDRLKKVFSRDLHLSFFEMLFEGEGEIIILIQKPEGMSDQVFLTLLKSIGLSTGEEKIRSTYRLASMKLAELKFNVSEVYWEEDQNKGSRRNRLSLKQLKERHFDIWGARDVSKVKAELFYAVGWYGVRVVYPMKKENTCIVLHIERPQRLNEKAFLQILQSLGLEIKKFGKKSNQVKRTFNNRRVSEKVFYEISVEDNSYGHTLHLEITTGSQGWIGHVIGNFYDKENTSEYNCAEDLDVLAKKFPQVLTPRGKVRVVAVNESELDSKYRGVGLGSQAYLEFARGHWDKIGKPFILLPDECDLGKTSNDAKRVWKTLQRGKPFSNWCIAILEKP